MKIRCLAVDDERLALDLLEDNISKLPFLELVGRCKNAFEVMAKMQTETIDLLFLDIQMPGLSGVEFVKTLSEQKPMVIFVTAYEQYALQGYELNIVDYLLKPVALERFIQAAQKAKDFFDLKNNVSSISTSDSFPLPLYGMAQNALTGEGRDGAFFFVHSEYSLVKIENQQITHIESMKDYIKIFLTTQTKPVITRMTMKAIEEKLPSNFFRCQKSYIVNLSMVKSLRNGELFLEKHKIPFSESVRNELMLRLKV
jgi:DNA-binding LytR/AlgR family response regulator